MGLWVGVGLLLVGLPITHMQPAHAVLADTFKEQLVELEVLLDIAEHLAAHLDVRDVDVGSLAQPVLRVLHAAHGPVKFVAAVPTGDTDHTEALPQGFQHMLAQLLQAIHHLFARLIPDAEPDGGPTGTHLPKREMWREHPL